MGDTHNTTKTKATIRNMNDDADDARDAAGGARTAAAVAHTVAQLITIADNSPDPAIRRAEKAASALVSDNAEKAALEADAAAEIAETAANINSEPPNMTLVPECEKAVAAARAAAVEARAAGRRGARGGSTGRPRWTEPRAAGGVRAGRNIQYDCILGGRA